VPKAVVLHHANIVKGERVAIGAIPVTNVYRTIVDCIDAHVSLEFVADAIRQAVARHVITKEDAKALRARARAA